MKDEDRVNREEHEVLEKALGTSRQNSRREIWLWLYLHLEKGLDLPLHTCNGETMREEIVKALKSLEFIYPPLALERDKYLLPDEALSWIGNDERQVLWLTRAVENLRGLRPPLRSTRLTGKDYLIGIIDLWKIDIAAKERKLKNLHSEWRTHQAKDVELEWFSDKKESSKRCICAWEWLEKNYLPMPRFQMPIDNYQELLIFFDKINVSPYERKAIIRDIKKRWSKKQFDERTADKKQVNLLLSKETISQLEALSRKHDLKRTQVVEALVAMETEVSLLFTKT
ncbi:hypothetical protein [Pseudomonas oryzihabitans]|uniref:hypothetical protein n=1 Tax=Pseudomonas oryzihabitans TaxID=47885 RepID=UPI0011A6F85B|nr:hypothetical protein [Pseudomonas oryzihabitans]